MYLYLFLLHVAEDRMTVTLNIFHLHEETSSFVSHFLWMIVRSKVEVEVC